MSNVIAIAGLSVVVTIMLGLLVVSLVLGQDDQVPATISKPETVEIEQVEYATEDEVVEEDGVVEATVEVIDGNVEASVEVTE